MAEVKVKVEEVKAVDDNLSGTTKQAMEMLSFFTAPVAGGIKTKFVYYVTMLFCMYLFINSIVTAAPTWAEPITSVELEHAAEIPMPDIYMCFESKFVDLFGIDDNSTDYVDAEYYIRKVKGGECQGLASSPSLGEVNNISSNTCFTNTTEASRELEFTTRVLEGESVEDWEILPRQYSDWTVAENAKAKQLAGLMPKTAGSADPMCFAYPANGAKFVASDAGRLAFNMWEVGPDFDEINSAVDPDEAYESMMSKMMNRAQYTTLYLVEAGGEVVKNGEYLVSGSFFPAFGSLSLASMTASRVKDEIAGDSDFRWKYRAGVTSVSDSSSHFHTSGGRTPRTYQDDTWTIVSGFSIHSFVVNKIHIRSITFGEVWSAIGGMWAGAILVMALVFTSSGYIRKADQKELLAFRFQSIESKKAAIKNVGGFNKGEEEAAEKQEMKRRLAKLEAQIATVVTATPATRTSWM